MSNFNFHQKAIIFNDQNRFLILKASYKGMKWDLPGGAVELPEEHEDALRREVKEEAGIEIKDLKPIEIESAYNKENDDYVLFIGYTCKATSTNVVLSAEHTEYKWVTAEEFFKLDATSYLKDFIRKYALWMK